MNSQSDLFIEEHRRLVYLEHESVVQKFFENNQHCLDVETLKNLPEKEVQKIAPILCLPGGTYIESNILGSAALRGKIDVLKYVLENYEIDTNSRARVKNHEGCEIKSEYTGFTPLMLA